MLKQIKSRSELEAGIYTRLTENPEEKKQLQNDPKKFLSDHFGFEAFDNISINLVEFDINELVLTLPKESASELADEELDEISGGTGGQSFHCTNNCTNSDCGEPPEVPF